MTYCTNCIRLAGLLALLCWTAQAAAERAGTATIVERATATLCDKRVAVLAELPSHGEGQAFAIKADIVQALVARCGFDALLIEAPIYDFLVLETMWRNAEAMPLQLDHAIGKFWWAKELAAWRRWLHAEANAGRVRVGGIDDQISITSTQARASVPDLIARRNTTDQAEHCRAAVERHLHWTYDDAHPFDVSEKGALRACAVNAAAVQEGQVIDRGQSDQHERESAMTRNFASYIERQVDPASASSRDDVLAANVLWHQHRLPKGAKLIVWTATVHGSKRQGQLPQRPAGVALDDAFGNDYGVVGFSAYAGLSSMAGRAPTTFEPAASGSLEAKATRADLPLAYLNASTLMKFGEIDSRLFGKLNRADWSTHFDGVIVVRTETPAQFEALQ